MCRNPQRLLAHTLPFLDRIAMDLKNKKAAFSGGLSISSADAAGVLSHCAHSPSIDLDMEIKWILHAR